MTVSAADHRRSQKVFIKDYYDGGKEKKSSMGVSNEGTERGPETALVFPVASEC